MLGRCKKLLLPLTLPLSEYRTTQSYMTTKMTQSHISNFVTFLPSLYSFCDTNLIIAVRMNYDRIFVTVPTVWGYRFPHQSRGGLVSRLAGSVFREMSRKRRNIAWLVGIACPPPGKRASYAIWSADLVRLGPDSSSRTT